MTLKRGKITHWFPELSAYQNTVYNTGRATDYSSFQSQLHLSFGKSNNMRVSGVHKM